MPASETSIPITWTPRIRSIRQETRRTAEKIGARAIIRAFEKAVVSLTPTIERRM